MINLSTWFKRAPVLLAFFIIPSLLYWVTVVLTGVVMTRVQTDALRKELSQRTLSVCRGYDEGMKPILNSAFDSLRRDSSDRAAFRRTLEHVMRTFGQRRVLIFLFDGSGTPIPLPGQSFPPGLNHLFALLRTPWKTPFQVNDEVYAPLSNILFNPDFIFRLRGRENMETVLGHSDAAEHHLVRGMYRWIPDTPPGVPAGMLAFSWPYTIEPEFKLAHLFASLPPDHVSCGFYSSGNMHLTTPELSVDLMKRMATQYKASGEEEMSFEDKQVRCTQFGTNGILVVSAASPKVPVWFSALAVLVFIMLSRFSIGFSLKLHSFDVPTSAGTPATPTHGSDRHISLAAKLFLLFGYGAALPLLATGTFGLLYLQEKKDELVQTYRTSSLNKLDTIDREFEGACQKRQLYYESLHQGFTRGTESYDTVLRKLEDLRNVGDIDDIFVVSSQSQMLVVLHAKQKNGYRWLLSRPLEERRSLFDRLLTHTSFKFNFFEALCLLGNKDNEEVASRITHKHTEKLKKLLPKVGRECVDYSNEQEGVKTLKSTVNSDLLVGEMAGSDVETSFRFLKLSQGKIVRVPRAIGEGYLYANTLKNAQREAQYVIFLFHDYPGLHREYLLKACVAAGVAETGETVRAYTSEDPFCVSYPIVANDPYQFVPRMLERSDRDSIGFVQKDGDQESYVSAVSAKQMSSVTLVHILPATIVQQQLYTYQRRVFVCMIGITLFSFTLGCILLRRFLVPVQQLAEGVKAIANRDFSYRVRIDSRDELGLLGLTLNRTIEYLGEMEVALTIQRTLFPTQSLHLGSLEVSGQNEMTQAVGGDYFDYFPLPSGKAVVLLGDVSGHGVSAALVTAMAKAGFHLLFEKHPGDPRLVFDLLNQQLYDILRRKKMMTCLCGLIDVETKTIQLLNAGQSFPVLVTTSGESRLCELVSNPLGVLKKGKYATSTVSLDCAGLVFYSDGLIEAIDTHGQMFTYDRFQQAATHTLSRHTSSPTQEIFQTVRQFTGSVPWNDDATVVIVRPVTPAQAQSTDSRRPTS